MVAAEPQEGLPVYGPRALSFPKADAFREGYVVKFNTADGAEWVGNFATFNPNGLNAVFTELGEQAVFVVAGSVGYLVDVRTKSLVREIGFDIGHCWFDDGLQAFVVSNGLWFEAFDADGQRWRSRRFSLDGIRNVKRQDHTITGEAWDISQSWLPFRLSLATGEVEGGSNIEWG
jgi:hypothetical protein